MVRIHFLEISQFKSQLYFSGSLIFAHFLRTDLEGKDICPIQDVAEEWLRLDKDSETRQEIQSLLDNNAEAELEARLRHRMTFGTAGLRARMGAGYARMNCLTVIQTSQGLAQYVKDQLQDTGNESVVVGYDVRNNSRRFAELAATAFLEKGFEVFYYDNYVHTPLVPFAVKLRGAAVGVMITASHNPACDNGYKVYWGPSGCQINSPHDVGIARSILNAGNLRPISWNTTALHENSRFHFVTAEVFDSYYEALGRLGKRPQGIQRLVPFVYTPIHGTGRIYMEELARQLGFSKDMVLVEAQAFPDSEFPTVKYPNPEEAGALDLAYATADQNNINLVLANDPDADRFAFAEKVNGEWYRLSGDQVGVLLASASLAAHSLEKRDSFKVTILTSAVSTGMIGRMALDEGFVHEETLTGFKWMGRRAMEGGDVLYAFEEALGYMWPAVCYDKDGIAAAAVFLRAVAIWQEKEGLTPWGKLQQLYERHGYFENMNTYFRSIDPKTITKKPFEKIAQLGHPFPTHVGGRKVLRWRDLTNGYDSDNPPSYAASLPTVSNDGPMITCWLAGKSDTASVGDLVLLDKGVRFTVRASGTEPKVKLYLECESLSSQLAKAGAAEVLRSLINNWFNLPGLLVESKYGHLVLQNSED